MARKVHPAKTHDEIFAEMAAGLREAVAIARGEADPSTYRVHAPDVDVKAVREKTGLSQDAFAGAFGFSTGTVRDWEQKRRKPDQSARMYLWVIGREPDMVRKALDPLIPRAKVVREPAVRQRTLRQTMTATKKRAY